jgi:tRNA pseudouridine(38-40) synthase
MLPDDIAISKIIEVKSDFHARFDAINRTYKYFIHFKKIHSLKNKVICLINNRTLRR